MLYDSQKLIQLRHLLHQRAELSGREVETSQIIAAQLKELEPDLLLEKLGGYGVAAVFKAPEPGPTLCFRAELDALPITETNDFDHKSTVPNTSHQCGHDGHMAIQLGLAEKIKDSLETLNGTYIILFQPAEETAQGALAVLGDDRFVNLKPNFMFALHNLPGYPMNSLIVREKVFAAASCGVKIHLTGKTSHAGHPENGNSPLQAMISIVQALNLLPASLPEKDDAKMVTIIHLRLGEEAFGTSPGEGEIMATFRSYEDSNLAVMMQETERLVPEIANLFSLQYNLEWVEKFASTVNDDIACTFLTKAAEKLNLEIIRPVLPFRWTEDFSYFSQLYKTAFFGLGAGEKQPQLHNPDYDFPDSLIETGVKLFYEIIKEVSVYYAADKLD